VNLFKFLTRELREIMAELGFRRLKKWLERLNVLKLMTVINIGKLKN